jgi:hypothetical protein
MSKLIVTHMSPDLDAISSSWLIKRFMPGWIDAEYAFVPAGTTLNGMAPDSDPNIIHVDTGLGQFDHHQTSEHTCATKRVFEYLVRKKYLSNNVTTAVERMVNFITDIDHFQEVNFPDPQADRYDFTLHQLIEGLKPVLHDDHKVVEHVFINLDAVLNVFKRKVKAENELKQGLVFNCRWGKTLALETPNEETSKLALKGDFNLVVRRNPETKHIRIKTKPDKKLNLTPIYEVLKKEDPKATWFLHISKNMLLNGSSKNPDSVPSSLSLQKVIEIIRKIT